MSRLAGPAALAMCALLTLTACGSGRPAAAAERTAGPAPAGTPRLAAGGQETIRIGPYTQVWDGPLPADPARAAVISDFRAGQILWARSNEALRPVAPILGYLTGVARRDFFAALAAGRARQIVPAGRERYFLTRVTALTGTAATVTTCDDGSRYRAQNPRTGQVNPAYSPQSKAQAYVFMAWHLVRQSGRWVMASFSVATLPDRRALPCQP